ncbi:MAG: AP2 domain-containing protein [Sedimentisphaerales bacterium]
MTNIWTKIWNWIDRIFTWPILVYRWWKYGYTFRRIYLGEGEYTIVEPRDYYWLKNYNWYLGGNGKEFYVFRNVKVGRGKTKMVSMHRQIMGFPEGLLVDHRNNIPLDNRRANLRSATQSQNRQNRRKRENTSSRFIGVSFDKKSNKWKVKIKTEIKEVYLGRFDNEIDAAKAYDAAAKKYHREFAKLNFLEA